MIERTTKTTRTDWRTPKDIVAMVREIFGGVIDVDPCASKKTKYQIALKNYSICGLEKRWTGNVFVNPPYGRGIGQWVDKGITEYEAHAATSIIWLVPARMDTVWWRRLLVYTVYFSIINGRLRFNDGDVPAQFPSALVLWGHHFDAFKKAIVSRDWKLYTVLC
jgi:DNA N-6-adenine-methyltransferase (Dam)